jgi:hypothetical protein
MCGVKIRRQKTKKTKRTRRERERERERQRERGRKTKRRTQKIRGPAVRAARRSAYRDGGRLDSALRNKPTAHAATHNAGFAHASRVASLLPLHSDGKLEGNVPALAPAAGAVAATMAASPPSVRGGKCCEDDGGDAAAVAAALAEVGGGSSAGTELDMLSIAVVVGGGERTLGRDAPT